MTKRYLRQLFFILLLLNAILGEAQHITHHFKVEDGLPSSEVYMVHQDHKGIFWFCTDRGVTTFDSERFRTYTVADGLSHNTVFRAYEAPNRDLWFTAIDGSISIYDQQRGQFKKYGLSHAIKRALKKVNKYNWIQLVGFTDSLVYFFPQTNKANGPVFYAPLHSADSLYTISIARLKARPVDFNNVEILDMQRMTGEEYHATKYSIFHIVKSVENQDYSITHKFVDSLQFLPYVIPSISQIDGIPMVCAGNRIITLPSVFSPDLLDQLVNVTSIIKDKENQYWISSVSDGVYVVPAYRTIVHGYNDFAKQWGRVRNIKVLSSGEVFVSTSNQIFSLEENFELKLIPKVKASMYAAENTFTSNGNIQEVRRALDQIDPQILHAIPPELISDRVVNFWLQNRNSASLKRFSRDISCNYAIVNDIGQLVLSTIDGVYLIYPGGELRDLGAEYSINSQVKNIESIGHYTIIPTLGQGIFVLEDEEVTKVISEADGLTSNTVNMVKIDRENSRLWCATNHGVTILPYSYTEEGLHWGKAIRVSHSEGLFSDYVISVDFKDRSAYCLAPNGLTVVDRFLMASGDVPPGIHHLSIKTEDSLYTADQLILTRQENNLEFYFSAVTMKKGETLYRYRLYRGMDTTDWTYSDQGRLWITNLDHGNYTFEVSAKGKNSVWGEVRLLQFSIPPHWTEIPFVRVLFLLGITLGITALVMVLLRRVKRENERQQLVTKLRLENTKLELSSLRGQMNPHFVFNVMNSIQKFILLEDHETANMLLAKFSRVIRSVLNHSNLEFIPLSHEITFLDNYLEIERMRFPERFKYEITVINKGHTEQLFVPPLFIQPLCENAIKHGFSASGGTLLIEITGHSDHVEVKVSDDGVGYYNKKAKGKESMGLQIVKRRLTIFKENGHRASIQIEALDNKSNKGTVILLELPAYYED